MARFVFISAFFQSDPLGDQKHPSRIFSTLFPRPIDDFLVADIITKFYAEDWQFLEIIYSRESQKRAVIVTDSSLENGSDLCLREKKTGRIIVGPRESRIRYDVSDFQKNLVPYTVFFQ